VRVKAAPPQAMWNTYIWVDSADETASTIREAGGSVVTEPFDVMDAGRMAVFTDPEGAAFCVWEAKENKGAQIVNEPGSLNFNGINTRDVEGAKSFYGSAFGWRTIALPSGAEILTLPGYGDFLVRDNPDLRKRMAEVDAPEGFEDAVATINPIARITVWVEPRRPSPSMSISVSETRSTISRFSSWVKTPSITLISTKWPDRWSARAGLTQGLGCSRRRPARQKSGRFDPLGVSGGPPPPAAECFPLQARSRHS
jgi:predicted enzyme related to lactoylglutathione lyase